MGVDSVWLAQGTLEEGLGGGLDVGVLGLLADVGGGGGAFLAGRRRLSVVPVEQIDPVSSSEALDIFVADPTDKKELDRTL